MQTSRSPVTGTEFSLPTTEGDREAIDAFVERNGKPVVAVQGLGFVGAVTSLVVANALTADYAVIGLDLATPGSYWKVAGINEGEFPVTSSDEQIEALYGSAREKGNLLATWDPYAYSCADIVLVDINLDVQKGGGEEGQAFGVDLSGFRAGMEAIADHCKEDVLILVETTVPPGTCEKVVAPIMAAAFERRGLEPRYRIGHSYERVMPGPNYIDSMRNFYRVYSGIDDASADAVEAFLKTIITVDEYPLTRLANTNATEMAKVLENSYRAMNIAFVQEWTEFAEHAGVNLFEVIDAIRMRPTHANLMKPGLGVGGYCLTKDPLLASWASSTLFGGPSLPQSEVAVTINDHMPEHTWRRISAQYPSGVGGKRCLLLGVSYLNDVGDTRYTPVAPLYRKLVEAGAAVTLHDPYVAWWEEEGVAVETRLEAALASDPEVVAICTAHTIYRQDDAVWRFLSESRGRLIVDTWGVLSADQLSQLAEHNTVIAIGRGDFA